MTNGADTGLSKKTFSCVAHEALAGRVVITETDNANQWTEINSVKKEKASLKVVGVIVALLVGVLTVCATLLLAQVNNVTSHVKDDNISVVRAVEKQKAEIVTLLVNTQMEVRDTRLRIQSIDVRQARLEERVKGIQTTLDAD